MGSGCSTASAIPAAARKYVAVEELNESVQTARVEARVTEVAPEEHVPVIEPEEVVSQPVPPCTCIRFFDAPASSVAANLWHGEIVKLLYTCKAAKDAYTCEGKLLCPWLVYTKETDADAESLVERVSLPNVIAARFIGTRLGLDTLKLHLKKEKLVQIERFSAKGCSVHAYDVPMFQEVFKTGSVRLLNLEKNMLGDDVVEKLVNDVLIKDDGLDTLNIRFNKVMDKGAAALAGLANHPTLTILNLKINAVGLDGATALARTLERNKVLKVLNLRNQVPRLPNAVAQPFADALRVNTTLTRLKLRRNRIASDGAMLLADALTANKRSGLIELDLQQNYVKADGLAALNVMLGQNATLEVVYVGGNPTSRAEVVEVGQFTELDRRLELGIVDDF
jgi:hypothetical protein